MDGETLHEIWGYFTRLAAGSPRQLHDCRIGLVAIPSTRCDKDLQKFAVCANPDAFLTDSAGLCEHSVT